MKFIDLKKQYQYFKKDIDKCVGSVLVSDYYLLGDNLNNFEKNFSKHIGLKNTVCVKNCTDAITLLIKELGKDKPIIMPNFGAYPTAVACKNVTDNIYYVDVDDSLTIDVNKLPDIKNGIVIGVNLFGNNINPKIKEYTKKNGHILIEDCAQSTGSGSGLLGDYSVFSFYPTKPLGSMGDGGAICSNNNIEKYKNLRFYGLNNGTIEHIGVNSRMDEIQSAILNVKLNNYTELNNKRISIANRYKKYVNGQFVFTKCIYHQFVILFNDVELIKEELKKRSIPYMIHYNNHVTDFEVLRGRNNDVGYRVNDKIISLPIDPFLTEQEIQKVEMFLKEFSKYEYR